MCDFAVRSGLVLEDVPQMQAARVRLFERHALPGRGALWLTHDFTTSVGTANVLTHPLDFQAQSRQLARLPRLTHLRLKDNRQLSDECVPHLLALPHLRSVQVHETSITASGLAQLARLPELRDLCVDEETGTEVELRELSMLMPRCEILIKGRGALLAGKLLP